MTLSSKLIKTQRTNMVLRQIRPWFVHDETILNLLYFLPRENFLTENLKKYAFFDMQLKLTEGRYTHPPKLEGRILEELKIKETDRILEIGSLNGYLSAVMSNLAKQVTTLEQDEICFELAQRNLGKYTNIELIKLGLLDFFNIKDHPNCLSKQKFDIIVINQPITKLKKQFFKALAKNGKLLCFEGDQNYMRCIIAKKDNNGKISINSPFEFNLIGKIIQTTKKTFDF